MSFTAIAGSTAPDFAGTVLDAAGAVVDLTGATVMLRIQHARTAEVVDFDLTIDDEELGTVSRAWLPGDLEITPGQWWGQYLVDRGGGDVEIWTTSVDGGRCGDVWGRGGLSFHLCPAIPAA